MSLNPENAPRPLLGRMLQKIAPSVGAAVMLEPGWGIVGQITFKNGRKSYFRYNSLDLNTMAASEIAKDKDYASFFMRRMKYPVVTGEAFYSDDWCATIGSKRNIHAAYRYARTLGWPVIVKPNSGSHGAGVAKVTSKTEFYVAMQEVFLRDRIGLVQEVARGRDYRITVFDGEVIAAYERVPLSVTGDGRSTIAGLLRKKQKEFVVAHRDTALKINDARIDRSLEREGLTRSSRLTAGVRMVLLDNANLSAGGEAVDVTGSIHQDWKDMAVRLTRDMGLRLCGVDLMTEGDIAKPPRAYRILEVNSSPGLDHYAKSGPEQARIVENFYRRVLVRLAA